MKEGNPTSLVRCCALAVALALAWLPGGQLAAAAAPPGATAVEGRAAPDGRAGPAAPAADQAASYARREKKASPELARFAGGDTVVITATTLVIVLLVVLIVVLIV